MKKLSLGIVGYLVAMVLLWVGVRGWDATVADAVSLIQVNTTSPQTLSNKTLTSPVLTSPTITGTTSIGAGATLTTPTISSPTFSGTTTGTYTLSGTLTITAPILSGTVTGTYTLAGTPSITSPTIATPTITGASLFGGTIRLPNNIYYLGRNAGNAADVNLAKVNASDQIEFGTTVKNFSLDANPTTALQPTTKQYVDLIGPATLLSAQGNPILNPALDVWQRGTVFATAANGAYSADRWRWGTVGTGVVTLNRSTNVPTVAAAGVLFNYSLEVDVTTADAAIAAGDLYVESQRIEGYNWRHYAQRQFTLSFWVRSSKTGIHCVAFRNNAAGTPDRSYVAEYTIAVADTWEYKTLTVSASPSAGTWDYTNGAGLEVAFVLAAGSTFQTTKDVWQTGDFYATSSQVNALDATTNVFRIEGVTLQLGSVATPMQFRSFQEELALSQRYYQKSFSYATTPAQSVGSDTGEVEWGSTLAGAVAGFHSVRLPTRLRASGSVILYNTDAANAQVRNLTDGADCTASSAVTRGDNTVRIGYTGTAGTAVGETLRVHWTADSEL